MAIEAELAAVAAAAGRVVRADGDVLVFCPQETNYQVHLKATASPYSGSIDKPLRGIVRVTARKVWTVPSGGNFVAPIFGPPKIIKGRVKQIDGRVLLVQAGFPVVVTLPDNPAALAAAEGAIAVGRMVNITALPGATFEIV